MVVVYRVKDLPARFARTDEMHLPQPAQLMGDGGFGHTESIRKGAHALFAVHEQGDETDAARVAEGAEEFGEFDGFEFGEFHG